MRSMVEGPPRQRRFHRRPLHHRLRRRSPSPRNRGGDVRVILLYLLAEATTPKAGPTEHLHEVVVEAIRNCPKPVEGEIAVCARDRGFSERYRIQRLDPRFAEPPPLSIGVMSGVGDGGTGSCGAVGAGGATGCALRDYNAWGTWKKGEKAKGRDFPW